MSIATAYQKPGTGRRAYMETRIAATVGGELAAVVVERDDGTCTVLPAGVWRALRGEPEEWPNRREGMRAVEVAVGAPVVWNEMAHTRGRTERRNHDRHASSRLSDPS